MLETKLTGFTDACNAKGHWGKGIALKFREKVCYYSIVAFKFFFLMI